MKKPRARVILIAAACAAGFTAEGFAADEIHWTFTGQTSVTVDWRGAERTVRYGLTRALRQTAQAVAPVPRPFSQSGPFREARITGLRQGTRYYYAIGNGPAHTFRTPPPRGASGFTFCVQGDIGNAGDWPRMAACQSMIAQARPDFVLCVGDLTYADSLGQRAVGAHFNDVMVWSQDAAYMPAWGEHEWHRPGMDDLRNYKGRFDLPNPQSSPVDSSVSHAGGGEDWYWFDYGNVRFIAYPEPWSGAWKDWSVRAREVMRAAQKDPAIDFIVTFGHRPAYSSGHHESEPELQGLIGPLRVRHTKYVLNLNAHSRNYERIHKQWKVTHVTAGTGGTDLQGSGDPGCPWSVCPQPPWSAFRAMHHSMVQFRVEADRIEGTVYCGPAGGDGVNRNDISCAQGSVIDRFTILPYGIEPGEPEPDEEEEEEEHADSKP